MNTWLLCELLFRYARTGGISFEVALRPQNGSRTFASVIGVPDAYCGDGSAAGDRVLLPQSALTSLTGRQDALKFGAMFFEVTATSSSGATRRTHVGVSSFSAPEGCVGMTEKVAVALGIDLVALARGEQATDVRFLFSCVCFFLVRAPAFSCWC